MNDTDKNKFEKANCVFCNYTETMLLYWNEKLEGLTLVRTVFLTGVVMIQVANSLQYDRR